MARCQESVCLKCRREGQKLFLKGDRCFSEKCAFERRAYAPGQHGQRRRKKLSDYGTQLREKQRAKEIYGVLERQFRGYYQKAVQMKGVTGENLLQLLERRLDNMVYRLGFSTSRRQARQLIGHRHFMVNGKVVDIASYLVEEGDAIAVRDNSKQVRSIVESVEAVERRGVPEWLTLDKNTMTGKIVTYPMRNQIGSELQEHLIVELYSK
ncbi:MAG: 30S ribosomal protein S4 [Deltaproteobacteria bacterium RIFCSPLOWO2_02_FULL_44_10]|nr:MAG: 30S ribosomal protein S4 [Deltaproteobacteria bacterium RIFCSPHIGHO2_02_FULL_44_16]OGQ45564.1 MAG: 30S ribosomal protein S4 [Deltaproteobacteria bacterium RIFCSPLOWO2_02_FULL_44_10]